MERAAVELEITKEALADAKSTADYWMKRAVESDKAAADLKAETEEQARLLGMSAERECDLRGKIKRLERELDDWKARYIQQNKDLGYEMRDPNLTIWGHAKKLQDENKSLQDQLDAAIMLGKMQERRQQRELEQVREQHRLASAAERLLQP